MKKFIAIIMALSLVLALTACGGGSSVTPAGNPAGDTSGPVASPTEPAVVSGNVKNVAMVCSGSLGDNGIFDMGAEALRQAEADFGIEYEVLEGKNDPSLYYDLLLKGAQGFGMVIVNPGYQFESYLEEIADEYPDTYFFYPDGICPVEKDNIYSISYREHEGSYVAGVMAGMMTTRVGFPGINDQKTLGFVGAVDTPTIQNFLKAFEQGAKSVDADIEVKSLIVGDHNDPAKGKELALTLFDQGCDIVYQAASGSGNGVTEAARERGLYTIGCDTDKSPLAPDNVMGSMLKNVTKSFYDAIGIFAKGGTMEKVQYEGLAMGWTGMYFAPDFQAKMPEDVLDAMTQAEEGIMSGAIAPIDAKS
ncbi:MAG: BMP family ABC transporter substrate-binding protein [Peptococcaceae bacterium]|jgi:basic membrane protein A|nr:BMP family ABC transporter substrate-binding protein [Peptococcaceae bacterium]